LWISAKRFPPGHKPPFKPFRRPPLSLLRTPKRACWGLKHGRLTIVTRPCIGPIHGRALVPFTAVWRSPNQVSLDILNQVSLVPPNQVSLDTLNQVSLDTLNQVSLDTLNQVSLDTLN